MTVNALTPFMVYIRSIIDQLHTSTLSCHLCRQPGVLPLGLCQGCHDDLPRLSGPLCRCALPCTAALAHSNDQLAPLCGRCTEEPPPYLGIQAALLYQHPVNRLINAWKHQRQLALERPLTSLLASTPWLPAVDLVTPVPLHWRRQWRRGFNQAAVLAARLARAAGIPFAPVLRRRHDRDHQQGRSAAARWRTSTDLYYSCQPLNGRHVLLVDDVITTSATTRACSRALLRAGAESVSVIALARVLPPDASGIMPGATPRLSTRREQQ